jgi:hypothetical protein
MEIKVGDKVTVIGPPKGFRSWYGWDYSCQLFVGDFVYEVLELSNDIDGTPVVKLTGDLDRFVVGMNFPRTRYIPVEYVKIFNEENKMQKFKVGDTVRIVKQVLHENGWDNVWTSDMDRKIGTVGKIACIDHMGVFVGGAGHAGYGFPVTSLELVLEDWRDSKFQYITPHQTFIDDGLLSKDLCIGILTKLVYNNVMDNYHVEYAVTFKKPSDKFSKVEARLSLSQKELSRINLGKHHHRREIVSKILANLYVNEDKIPSTYRTFVKVMLLENLWVS